jgi:hypothetical protein
LSSRARKKVQRFGFIGFRNKKKEKQQHKSTPIKDFKLERYNFANFKSEVHEVARFKTICLMYNAMFF